MFKPESIPDSGRLDIRLLRLEKLAKSKKHMAFSRVYPIQKAIRGCLK